MQSDLSDDQLLTSRDPEAFGAFYARHLAGVERFFGARLGNRDTAADLAAETFAAALVARRRFVPGDAPAAAWLYAIARRRLIDFYRRGAVERRTREAVVAEAELADRLQTASEDAELADVSILEDLPPEQRDAIVRRILVGHSYAEIATAANSTEHSVRQRVSRGLRALRAPLAVYRAAGELARQNRGYRLEGGHRTFLASIPGDEPLDCSSSASLILSRAGLFDSDVAWTSSQLGEEWGEPGEGRHLTVWTNQEHVWLEFRFGAGHVESFDPTPSRLAPRSGALSSRPRGHDSFQPRHVPGM